MHGRPGAAYPDPAGFKRGDLMTSLAKAMAVIALCAASVPARAEDPGGYPGRTIRLVVPFPPGGPNDIIGRVFAQKMQEFLGQTVIIDNRAGAGGVLGTDNVAKSPPDGYSIAISSAGALAISTALQDNVLYDPLKDLAPVTLVAKVPELLVASTTLPAADVKALIALARAKPGAINYGSSGPGSMPHLAGALFAVSAGINIVHVPYRGAAPAINDLIGHQVQIMFLDLPVLLPHIQSGTVKALAAGGRERVEPLPDLPTLKELGYPQVEADNWYGMVAPAKTPPAIIAKLNAAAVGAMKAPEVREKLAPQGAILAGDTPEEFAAFMASEIAKWTKVVQTAGIKVN
jgi:tripartite-type tricarboxylate transporter receptor subunit TctC